MEINLLQAIAITLLSVMSSLTFPLLGDIGGYFSLGRPLISGTLVGLILGDVKTGMLIGASLNAVYMSSQAVGNVMSTDVTLAGFTATTLAMAGSNSTSVALALSIPLGLFGAMLWTVSNAVSVFFVHKCDDYAQQGDVKKMWNVGIWIPFIIFNTVRFVTTFLVVYYGSQYTNVIESLMPEKLTLAMGAVGGLLPAVGMALLLKVMITNKSHWCYFLLGFLAFSLFNISAVPLTLIAIIVAVIIDQTKHSSSTNIEDRIL